MKKFTLLELLVVVAVMIILMSLLLPALQKAKDAGRAVVCLSNQKQCTILAMSYVGDYNGSLVVYESSSGDRPWPRYLYDYGYLKDYNITVCPSWSPFKYDTTLRATDILYKTRNNCLMVRLPPFWARAN